MTRDEHCAFHMSGIGVTVTSSARPKGQVPVKLRQSCRHGRHGRRGHVVSVYGRRREMDISVMMGSTTFAAGLRSLVVAGLLGGAALTGTATAHAEPEPAPAAGSSATIPAAADCQLFWPSPYQVCGDIRDLYVSLGGVQSTLSFPSGPEVTNPDGSKYSTFVNGTIYWSAATGAYVG
jgi:hypothetical protein